MWYYFSTPMRYFPLLFVLFCLQARAESAHFTTVFLDDENVVYVGVKHGEAPGISEIISFPFDSGIRTNIPLPTEIAQRDVIGLITAKSKLFVLTNGSDTPMLHTYDREKGRWNKIGQVNCPTFTKVTFKSSQMIFSCEVGVAKKGKVKVSSKSISLRKDPIFRTGVWRFPEFMLRYKGRVAILEGEAPNWDKLRLRTDNSPARTISAEDLLKLPLPGAEAKVVNKPAPTTTQTNTD